MRTLDDTALVSIARTLADFESQCPESQSYRASKYRTNNHEW
jgi:hypothetical protein